MHERWLPSLSEVSVAAVCALGNTFQNRSVSSPARAHAGAAGPAERACSGEGAWLVSLQAGRRHGGSLSVSSELAVSLRPAARACSTLGAPRLRR